MSNLATELLPTDLIATALSSCRAKRALVLVSLENSSELESQYGLDASTLIKQTFQRHVSVLLRPQDSLIELTSTKVALVLDDLIDIHHLQLAGMKLDRIFDPAIELNEINARFEVCAGFLFLARVSTLPAIEDLMRKAESALTDAQSNDHGGDRYVVATLEEEARVEDHWQIGMRLREAIEAHNIYMDYQPKVDLASGAVTSAEALVRWRDKGSVLPPGDYLPALQADMMWELTVYCFRRVLRDILDYGIDIPVAINFDPVTLSEADLVPLLQRETSLWGVAPEQIILEITEVSELLDIEAARKTLAQVRELGFRVSIDDFGSGHSNVERLRDIPMDELKIDRSFSGNIINNEQNQVITKSVIELAQSLGVVTVAEGIEDAETLELLADWGCQIGQGFYLSAPLSIEALKELTE